MRSCVAEGIESLNQQQLRAGWNGRPGPEVDCGELLGYPPVHSLKEQDLT